MADIPHIQINAKSAVNPTAIDTTQLSSGLKQIGSKLGSIQDSRDKIDVNMRMREASKAYMNEVRASGDYSSESLDKKTGDFMKKLSEEYISPSMQNYITDVGDKTKADMELMIGAEYSQKTYGEAIEKLEVNHAKMSREEINLNTDSIVEQSKLNFEAGFISLEQYERSRVNAKSNALTFNITDDLSKIIPDLDNISDGQIKILNEYVKEASTSEGKIIRGGIGNEDVSGLINPYLKAVNNRKIEMNFGFTGDVNSDMIKMKNWDTQIDNMSDEQRVAYNKQSKKVQDRYVKYNSGDRIDFAVGLGTVIPERGAPTQRTFEDLMNFSIQSDYNIDPATLSDKQRRRLEDQVLHKVVGSNDDGTPIYYKDVAHGLDSTTREILRQNTAGMNKLQKVEMANGIANGTLDYSGSNINNFAFKDYIEKNAGASNMLKNSIDEALGLNSVDHFVGDSGDAKLMNMYSQIAETDLDSLKAEYAREHKGESLVTNFNEAKRKNGWMTGTDVGALYNKLGQLRNTSTERTYFIELAKDIDGTMMKAFAVGGHEAIAKSISDSLDKKYTSVTIGGRTRTVDAKYNSINVEGTLNNVKGNLWTDRGEFLTYIGTDGRIRNVESEGMIYEEFNDDSGRVNLVHKRTGQTIFDSSRKEDGSSSPVPLTVDLFAEQSIGVESRIIGSAGIEEYDLNSDYTTPSNL